MQALLSAAAAAWLGYLQLPRRLQLPLTGDDLLQVSVLAAVLYLALEAVGRGLRSAWLNLAAHNHGGMRQAVGEYLGEAFCRIIAVPFEGDEDRIEPLSIGLSAFAVGWTAPRLWRPRLVRLYRFRPTGFPPESPRIHWTKGKGLIGQVWKSGKMDIHDTDRVWGHLRGCSRREWRREDKSVRAGLSYGDFKAIRSKYKGGMAG